MKKKLILVTLTVIAFIVVVGSVGAYETNSIGFGQCLIQVGIASITEFLSLRALTK